MAAKRWHGGDDKGHGWDDGDSGFDSGSDFNFDLPKSFKFDLDDLDLKAFGKITDYEVGRDGLSVTLGNRWTFSIEGSDLDVDLNGKNKLPDVNGGTIEKFAIDGPGGADFSISGLDMSATDFYQALIHFKAAKLLDLVLGGDETIFGSSFSDLLYGGAGNDTLSGNKGRDWLIGGDGDDRVVGGLGNDYLEGKDGADTFAFAPKSGKDVITDFDAWSDTIDLSAYGLDQDFCTFLDENVRESRGDERCNDYGDVVIDLGNGNSVKLLGISRWELNADNVTL
jgi:Ca2+-binding RTX toxin-like protein